MRPSALTQVRRRGCVGHRGLERREVVRIGGLPVTALADTWCDLGEVLGRGLDIDDLVVVGDAVLWRLERAGPDALRHDPDRHRTDPTATAPGAHPSSGRTALADSLQARVRPRGKAALTVAAHLVRSGSRSPMETRARLMFLRAGFPEPELNAAVHALDAGWLLEGDLVWRRQRVIGEYQGSDHASLRRRSKDSLRAALAEDEGWRVIEIYAEDVYHPPRRRATLTRFARALALDARGLFIE